ncbi:MAG: FtsK/SpoIIIE domain-containing protein [Gammaproteobacteria bacterium]
MHQKNKYDNKSLHLGHDLSKLIFNLNKLINRKIKAIGFPIVFFLFYMILNEKIKNSTLHNHTHFLIFMIILIYIICYITSLILLNEYYNIKFFHAKVITGNQYINFTNYTKSNKYEKIWLFTTNVPVKYLIANSDIVANVLKNHVVEIRQRKHSFTMIEIITSSKVINYKELAKFGDSNIIKLQSAFKLNGINIYNCSQELEQYKDTIYFDCDEKKLSLLKVLDEIKHLTAISNMTIYSNQNTDFKLIIEKPVGIIDFTELLIESDLDKETNILLGIDNNNREIAISIFDIYHSIVAGSTGYGKSNLGHVIISSLLKSGLDIVNVLLDPKKSELKRYRDIQNVFYSGDKKEIIKILELLVIEMDKRNILFEQDKFIKDIDTWNIKMKHDKLPYIVIYIEEIADLILSTDKELKKSFENSIIRLTQLGRSTGFRLFLSTQFPKKEIINTVIKANCATRFGFGTITNIESRVILDDDKCKGLNKGQMILQTNDIEIKIKVPLLKNNVIEDIVYYLEDLDKLAKKTMSIYFISNMSNTLNNCKLDVKKDIPNIPNIPNNINKKVNINKDKVLLIRKYNIENEKDLLNFYIDCNENNQILSVDKTLKHINIGKTKLQEFRKKLITDEYLIVDNKKVFLNKNKLKNYKIL